MRIGLVASLAGALLMSACGQRPPETAESWDELSASPIATGAADDPDLPFNLLTSTHPVWPEAAHAVALVRDLNDWPGVVDAQVRPLSEFFSQDVTTALLRSAASGAINTDVEERWFSSLSGANDVDYRGIVDTIIEDDDRATVRVTFEIAGESRRRYYWLCKRHNGDWRILEIATNRLLRSDNSLRAALGVPELMGDSVC